ncbi:MAG: hypothetical protein ABR936_15345 [Bacteroidota bacterium]|jgi:hypothetical protein
MELDQNFKEFVELLNRNRVEYLIVGGYAVIAHGYPRSTGDLDVWVNPTQSNAKKVLHVLKEFGFGKLKITEKNLFTKGTILQFGYVPLRIDVLTDIDGVEFEEAFPRRFKKKYSGIMINFIGKEALTKNKSSAGRKRDLADLEELTEKKRKR